MQGEAEVAALRLGHRPGRDERTTTHVGLAARALGANRAILTENAAQSAETVRDITDRFGGPFAVEVTDSPKAVIRGWDGTVVHLTMYGLPIQEVEEELRAAHRETTLLVVVGGGKVPFEIYEQADWNVAVTNQPHSEIAGLAVFLDRLFDGRELEREWADAEQVVVPEETGKTVESVDGE